jgi:hypothetical protein
LAVASESWNSGRPVNLKNAYMPPAAGAEWPASTRYTAPDGKVYIKK